MSLTVCTWLWGSHFAAEYVNKLRRMVSRNLRTPHEFVVVAESAWYDYGLDDGIARVQPPVAFKHAPNCIRRMKMYDPAWLREYVGDVVLMLDLDVVVTGDLTEMVEAPLAAGADLALWKVGYPCHNRVYAGGVVLQRNDPLKRMWDAFLEDPLDYGTRALKYTYDREPGEGWGAISDQAMLNYWVHLQGQALVKKMWQWTGEIQPYNDRMTSLPHGTKMVTIGHENLESFQTHAWAKEHWR